MKYSKAQLWIQRCICNRLTCCKQTSKIFLTFTSYTDHFLRDLMSLERLFLASRASERCTLKCVYSGPPSQYTVSPRIYYNFAYSKPALESTHLCSFDTICSIFSFVPSRYATKKLNGVLCVVCTCGIGAMSRDILWLTRLLDREVTRSTRGQHRIGSNFYRRINRSFKRLGNVRVMIEKLNMLVYLR